MGSTLRVMYDLIDRLIDSQISNTAMLTNLFVLVRENQIELKDINSHFTNGFRSELKEHISEETDITKKAVEEIAKIVNNLEETLGDQYKAVNDRIDDILARKEEDIERIKKVDKFLNAVKRGSTYVKWIVAVIVAVGTVVGGIATVVENWPWTPTQQKTPTKTPQNP